jgi:hypothetical protein
LTYFRVSNGYSRNRDVIGSVLGLPYLHPSITFERVEDFKYLGTTITRQNSIPEEIKSRLRPENACYLSVHNLLSSRLLSKNLKIKIYRTIILSVVLYGCETWWLTLREERNRWCMRIQC